MGRKRIGQLVLTVGLAFAVTGCEDGFKMPSFKKKEGTETTQTAARASQAKAVERDVEAPEVFQSTETGLWDGRPSLGGVWVAHPDVTDPERVMIRNEANGKSVVGALFRRERNNPGPLFQVSSDTASAIGMLAGQPTKLSVVALRRETVPVVTPEVDAADAPTDTLDDPETIETKPLDPIASASAAIDAAEGITPETKAATGAAAITPAKTNVQTSPLAKPFVQIGIFNVEENADAAGAALKKAGLVPTVLDQESNGKAFWRVVVGPAVTTSERASYLAQVKKLGYGDAYFVSN